MTTKADGFSGIYHVLAPVLGVVVILLNVSVLVSIALVLRRVFVKAKTVYIFLGNVAFADTINGVLILVGLYYPRGSQEFCIFIVGAIISCTLSSLLSVALIAVDRFLFILHGLRYRQLMTVRRAYVFITITILVSIVVGFTPLVNWDKNVIDQTSCVLVRIAPRASLIIIATFGILPVGVVLVLYGIIFYRALRRVDQLRSMQDGTTPHVNVRVSTSSKWKAIKVVFFTTGAFVATWMPYFVAMLAFVFADDPTMCGALANAIASPLAALGILNSVLNPVIYAWWYEGFRKAISKLCHRRARYNTTKITRCPTVSSSVSTA